MNPMRALQLDGDEDLMRESFRLRYAVYCEERGYMDTHKHQYNMESDAYDRKGVSFHLGVLDGDKLVGSVRIIKNTDLGFPIFEVCNIFEGYKDMLLDIHGAVGEIAEVSRLVIAKESRGSTAFPVLFELLIKICKENNITYLLLATEVVLAKKLEKRFNIPCTPIGPEVDLADYGKITPYHIHVGALYS